MTESFSDVRLQGYAKNKEQSEDPVMPGRPFHADNFIHPFGPMVETPAKPNG
jgi:hypothetical protein